MNVNSGRAVIDSVDADAAADSAPPAGALGPRATATPMTTRPASIPEPASASASRAGVPTQALPQVIRE